MSAKKFKYATRRQVAKLSDRELDELIKREPFPRPKGYPRWSPAQMARAERQGIPLAP